MPAFGGYCPFPLRFGGKKPRVKVINDALNAARGTAYDVTTTSNVWVENNAIARAISDVYSVNELLANQFDPSKMSTLLSRWEKIYGVVVLPEYTLAERRANLARHVRLTGVVPTYQQVIDELNEMLDPVTVELVVNAPGDTDVISSWPGGWYVQSKGTSPPTVTLTGQPAADYSLHVNIMTGGSRGAATFQWSTDGLTFSEETVTDTTVALGSTGLTAAFASGTYDADNYYTSNPVTNGFWSDVGHVSVLCTKPSWMTEPEYHDKIAPGRAVLDKWLPAWVTFSFVKDGTTVGEFILDDTSNLDNERL